MVVNGRVCSVADLLGARFRAGFCSKTIPNILSGTRGLLQEFKYGQMSEQFMPFVSAYPWDPQRFRFIGSPIDGVQFEEDRVILIEFKTATSKLSARQRQIRDQVQGGRVEFQEFRLE